MRYFDFKEKSSENFHKAPKFSTFVLYPLATANFRKNSRKKSIVHKGTSSGYILYSIFVWLRLDRIKLYKPMKKQKNVHNTLY